MSISDGTAQTVPEKRSKKPSATLFSPECYAPISVPSGAKNSVAILRNTGRERASGRRSNFDRVSFPNSLFIIEKRCLACQCNLVVRNRFEHWFFDQKSLPS